MLKSPMGGRTHPISGLEEKLRVKCSTHLHHYAVDCVRVQHVNQMHLYGFDGTRGFYCRHASHVDSDARWYGFAWACVYVCVRV